MPESDRSPFTLRKKSLLAGGAGLGALPLGGGAWSVLRSDAEHSGSQLLLEADGVRIGELIRSGDLDPLEILQAAIDGLTELGSTLSVLDSERFAAALVDVGGRDDLPGVFGATPILVKDLIDYPDLPFRSGSRMLAGNVSQWRSPYIERLEAAGLVVLGKSTTPEFGLSVTTESLLNGPTRNPWDHTLSPGGSSGGSSAAVASRLVPIAHANDAGGSIRIPASLCGVFGLKPSRGRMVSARQNGLAADIAVEHAVTNTVRDSARVFAATEQSGEGADFAPVGFVTGSSGQRLRIGLLETGMYGDSPEPEVAASIRATASILEGLGHVVEPTAWPTSGDEVISHFLTIWSAGAAFVANLYLEQAGVPPDPTVLEPFTLGMANRFVSRDQGELPAAQQYVDDLNTASSPWFDEYDVLLSPVTSRARLPLGEFAPDTPFDSLLSSIIEFADYTPLHNMAGTPAMSVPVGTTDDGLPIGSHFAAKKGDEGRLFELAYELEAAAPWIDRHPVR